MKALPARTLAVSIGLALVACGPSIRTAVRFKAEPLSANETKQTKDGLTLELSQLAELPPELKSESFACTRTGAVEKNQAGEAREIVVGMLHSALGEDISRLVITNSTDHILRFNLAAARVTDPAANTYDLMSKEDALALALGATPCDSRPVTKLRTVKLFERNVEIMPGSTWKGFVVFAVPRNAMEQAGTWTYSFFDVPVAVDAAGAPTRKTRFDVRFAVKKFVDTYEVDMLGGTKLVSSKAVD